MDLLEKINIRLQLTDFINFNVGPHRFLTEELNQQLYHEFIQHLIITGVLITPEEIAQTNIFAEATLNRYQQNQIQFGLDFQNHQENFDRKAN
jgi:hypothetical protein